MAITYTPAFQHEDWIDNVDRVQAGGDNGFNLRFHALESEFSQLSALIAQIDAALTALGQAPPPRILRSSFTPNLVATGASGWSHGPGFAQKQANVTSAQGMMSIDLPHGVNLRSFRATGRNVSRGSSLRITLHRQGVDAAAVTSDILARLDGNSNPFDVNTVIEQQYEVVDTDHFRYFITAELNGAAGTDQVILFTFQIAYMTG